MNQYSITLLALILFTFQAQARLQEGSQSTRDQIPISLTQTEIHPLCKEWKVQGEVCAQRLIRVFSSLKTEGLETASMTLHPSCVAAKITTLEGCIAYMKLLLASNDEGNQQIAAFPANFNECMTVEKSLDWCLLIFPNGQLTKLEAPSACANDTYKYCSGENSNAVEVVGCLSSKTSVIANHCTTALGFEETIDLQVADSGELLGHEAAHFQQNRASRQAN